MTEMKNSAYWQKRFTELEEQLNAYAEKTIREIHPVFDRAAQRIDLEIEKWLIRIAENNEISMSAARKLLNKNQLEEFRWSVEEYIEYGKINAMNQQWMKQLENASAKYHISRLEALKIQVQQQAEVAFGNYLDKVDEMARKSYTEEYYRAAFEVQKGLNFGWQIASVDENKLFKLLANPWPADGRNFSDRIWNAKVQMVSELHSELTRACLLGKGPDEAIKKMSRFVDKKFKNAKVQAGRLVMTEQAFFSAAAQQDAFNQLGVEEFEIVATLDSHTSLICQDMDGRHFPMSQYEPGVTAPPFHVWCRSTTCPYFDDEFSAGDMRAARNEEGKTYYVPADMKYSDWKAVAEGGNNTKLSSQSGKRDVTIEYEHKAKCGKGDISYDDEYNKDLHKEEIRFAEWIHNRFGGDIKLLNEANQDKVKTADYLWHGRLWDLKTVTTEKSANAAVRKGLKQIQHNPGGIMLDYRNREIDLEILNSVIERRLNWREALPEIDIMIILDDAVHVWRY